MASQSEGIQKLLDAEKEATRLVDDARKCKYLVLILRGLVSAYRQNQKKNVARNLLYGLGIVWITSWVQK